MDKNEVNNIDLEQEVSNLETSETTEQEATPAKQGSGISQEVSGISDFLSFEELGLTDDEDDEIISVKEDDTNKAFKSNRKPEDDGVELGAKAKVIGNDDKEGPILKLDGVTEEDVEILDDKGNVDLKEIARVLMDNGMWEQADVLDTPDGEVSFEDLEMTPENFLMLMQYNNEAFAQKLTHNTVTTDGMSDFTKSLINIEKNGGNVAEALRIYQEVKEPLAGIDLDNPNHQAQVCLLRLEQNGITGEEARDLVEVYASKGVLKQKAEEFKGQLEDAFNNYVKEEERRAIEEEQRYQETIKNYRTNLRQTFKSLEDFKLSDSHIKKLVNLATTELPDGKFELDTLIDLTRSNPVDAAELVLFLTDKEEFIRVKSKRLLDEQNKNTLKKISIIPKGKSNIDLGGKSKRSTDNEKIISFDRFKV